MLIYADSLSASLFRFWRIHDFLDFRGETVESFVDIDIILGWDFEKRDTKLISKPLTLFSWHCSFFFPVTFVADKDFVNTLACMLLDIWEPGPDVLRINPDQHYLIMIDVGDLLLNERSSVTSYTRSMPIAPL